MKGFLMVGVVLTMMFVGSVFADYDFTRCEERKFIVTAYYSPVSGQLFYYKSGFVEEVILNGEGYTGASGKPVFPGMLAAPQTYPFGAMIYFPGFGIGEVADRGGAIVNSGQRGYEYDRIDIWMGRGEEGLMRALLFGKQTLTGWYCPPELKKQGFAGHFDIKKVGIVKGFFDLAIWVQQLEYGRRDIWVWHLQYYLQKLGYISKVTGFFGPETKKALCNYQVKRGIVSARHPDCGKYGSTTRYRMKLDIQEKGLLPEDVFVGTSVESVLEGVKEKMGLPHLTSFGSQGQGGNNSKKLFQFYKSYSKNESNKAVGYLQEFLTAQGVYSGVISQRNDIKTISALCDWQVKKGLVSKSDKACGYLGPKTRTVINNL